MEKSEYLKQWQQTHPAERVNHHLRELLAHYIGFFPEGPYLELSESALDIMALMESVEF